MATKVFFLPKSIFLYNPSTLLYRLETIFLCCKPGYQKEAHREITWFVTIQVCALVPLVERITTSSASNLQNLHQTNWL